MYNFVDTTTGQAREQLLPAEALKINGEYIENLISGYRTLYVTGRELNETEITEIQIGMADGADYRGKRLVPRVITVGYQIISPTPEQYREKFNELCKILSQEQAQLIFADEPDKYYIGTKSEVGEVDAGKLNTVGEFTFYCCDPYKYAVTEKTFTATTNEEGVLEAIVKNNGTADAAISYTIKHKHENGYVGIVGQNGAMQFGKIEEADGESYKANERLSSFGNFATIADDHGTNVMHPSHSTTGSLTYETTDRTGTILHIKTLSTIPSGSWGGGMRTLVLPADSEGVRGAQNFYSYMFFWFETGLMGQTGAISVAYLTEDNKLICGYNIVKSDKVGNNAVLEFVAAGNPYKVMREFKFTPSMYDKDNPFNEGRGHCDIRKEGEKITFFWFGAYYSYIIPAVKNMKCAKIQVAFEQSFGRNLTNTMYLTRAYLKELYFIKLGVDKWRDIPNRYGNGDTLFIDGDEQKPYLNGMPIQRDEIVGTKYFKAPPGESKVEFYYSTFCSIPPAVTISIRERWL